MAQEKIDHEETSHEWDQLIEDLVEGRLSILELMEATRQIWKDNWFGYVQHIRGMIALMRDRRVAKRLHQDIIDEIGRIEGTPKSISEIQEGIRSKDGYRFFKQLESIRKKGFGSSRALLTGSTFDECLDQYRSITSHAERLWGDACDLYRRDNYPLATFVSILVIEEIGKLDRLWWDLLEYDHPKATGGNRNTLVLNHRRKHFVGVISGAVVNARLDRILGVDRIRQLLQDADSGKIEGLRQACLYLDVENGQVVIPADRIGADRARFFTVLAGELMAELLGAFPWEFERMLQNVINFEVEIGFPPDVVRRGGKAVA